MGWAEFWPIFSRIHLVTLLGSFSGNLLAAFKVLNLSFIPFFLSFFFFFSFFFKLVPFLKRRQFLRIRFYVCKKDGAHSNDRTPMYKLRCWVLGCQLAYFHAKNPNFWYILECLRMGNVAMFYMTICNSLRPFHIFSRFGMFGSRKIWQHWLGQLQVKR
jgi:hypothetical protein